MVYATDRSKAAVLVQLLYRVALWFLLRGVLSCLTLLLVLIFSVPFSIVITSRGEEKAGLYASHAFVYLASVFCLFPLPFGVGAWLQIVIVALPGLLI